ncbi:HepT-like ribonuclease domain-containing protein [Microbacterium sp. F2]|uniref:HepT-like ribonuclease domain-containing protein n=1 Tax=Microbacterium sp. F2 TaxID=3422228 RepID=UPI003FD1FA48
MIGEALNNLRRAYGDTAALIPEVERIIGLRNVLAHGYAVVDDSVVWTAASPSSERSSTGW